MQSSPIGLLRNLLPATETIREDQRIVWCSAHRRKQYSLSALDTHFIMVSFISKRSRHSATTGIEDFVVEPHLLQYVFLICKLQFALVVAVPVNYCFPLQPRRPIVFHLPLEKFTEQEGLALQSLRILVPIDEVRQLISEHRHATGLQAHNRNTRLDSGPQSVQNLI